MLQILAAMVQLLLRRTLWLGGKMILVFGFFYAYRTGVQIAILWSFIQKTNNKDGVYDIEFSLGEGFTFHKVEQDLDPFIGENVIFIWKDEPHAVLPMRMIAKS